MVADYVRFNRAARALLADPATTARCGAFLEDEGFSRWFVERLLVPQAAAVWSADPEQMWSFPARFLVALLRPPRDALAHRAPAVVDDRRRLGALRRGAHRALRRPHPRAHPVAAVTRHPTHVDVVRRRASGAEEFDEVVIAAHADQALALLTDPSDGRGRDPGRLPLPAQRGGPAHRPRAAAAPPRRLGGMELSPARRAARPLRRHLLHEPPAVPRRRPAVLRDAQPHGRDRSRARHPRDPLRPSRLHARGDGRAGPPRRDQRRRADALLRRLLALGLPRGRRGQRRTQAVARMRERVPA